MIGGGLHKTGASAAVSRILDTYNTNIKFGWAIEKSLKTTYNNGVAMTIQRNNNGDTADISFSNGPLAISDINAFCGANKGKLLSVYNHMDGTECRFCYDGPTYGYIYSPEIWDGAGVPTNENGDICVDFNSTRPFMFMTNFANTETWSSFIMSSRQLTKSVIYQAGSNQINLLAETGTTDITYQSDILPLSNKVNGVLVNPAKAATLLAAQTINTPKVISQMRWSPNSGWTYQSIGGSNTNSRGFQGLVQGELVYSGDKTSEESDIVNQLITDFNL